MGDLSFSKEDAPEETPEEETTKKALTEELDAIAEEIQEQNPVVAFLIDRVSDGLDK